MQTDGSIDYRGYSLHELREARALISETKYPINLRNLQAELAARTESERLVNHAAVTRPAPAAQHRAGRPMLVWVITAFSFLGALFSVFGYYVTFSGEFDLPERLQAQIELLTPIDHARLALSVALKVVAAALLFRMRKRAAHLFTLALVLDLFGRVGRLALSVSKRQQLHMGRRVRCCSVSPFRRRSAFTTGPFC